jgi:predicted nucleic acid-binding protein
VIAVVDTGPLYAAVDADDADHGPCVSALTAPGVRLVIPAMVVAEASYLVGSRLGPAVEAAFLGSLVELDVEAPLLDDWKRIAELVEQYADFPLGGTDASVIALAERLRTDLVSPDPLPGPATAPMRLLPACALPAWQAANGDITARRSAAVTARTRAVRQSLTRSACGLPWPRAASLPVRKRPRVSRVACPFPPFANGLCMHESHPIPGVATRRHEVCQHPAITLGLGR